MTDDLTFAPRVTLAEAAEMAGVHINTMRTRVKADRYPSWMVVTEKGEAYAIDRTAVDAEIAGQPLPPAGTYVAGQGLRAMPRATGVADATSYLSPVDSGDKSTVIDQDGAALTAPAAPAAASLALVGAIQQALAPTIAELARSADALHDAAQELALTRNALERAHEDLDRERALRLVAERRMGHEHLTQGMRESRLAIVFRRGLVEGLRDLGNATSKLTGKLPLQ